MDTLALSRAVGRCAQHTCCGLGARQLRKLYGTVSLGLPYNMVGEMSVPGRPSREQVYRRLNDAVAELRDRLGGLPSLIEAEDISKNIWYEEAHNSTAIEGNTLILKQVERLLGDGIAVGSKELREYMEVRGYADAARWVYGQALEPGAWHDGQLLTLTELRYVHTAAMAPVWMIAPHPDAPSVKRREASANTTSGRFRVA